MIHTLPRLLMVAALLLVAANGWASPVSVKWVHERLLGADPTGYVVERTERVHPGSYYEFTEGRYLVRYSFEALSSTPTLKRAIREVRHYQPETTGTWKTEVVTSQTVCVEQYLAEKQVEPIWTTPQLLPLEWRVDEDGLIMARGDRKVRLLDLETLQRRLEPPTFGWETWKPAQTRVLDTAYRIGEVYLIGMLTSGLDPRGRPVRDPEMDYIESFVPLSAARVAEAIEALKE